MHVSGKLCFKRWRSLRQYCQYRFSSNFFHNYAMFLFQYGKAQNAETSASTTITSTLLQSHGNHLPTSLNVSPNTWSALFTTALVNRQSPRWFTVRRSYRLMRPYRRVVTMLPSGPSSELGLIQLVLAMKHLRSSSLKVSAGHAYYTII